MWEFSNEESFMGQNLKCILYHFNCRIICHPLSRSLGQNVRSYPSYRVIQLCSHHKFNERSALDQHWQRDDICTRHISIRPEEKWAQENLTALIFAAGCRPPAPRSPLCTSLWVRRAPKLQRGGGPAVLSEQPR